MKKNNKTKYLVVGSCPFTGYTGTTTYTSIKKIDQFNDKEKAVKCVIENWDECGGLIEIFEIE